MAVEDEIVLVVDDDPGQVLITEAHLNGLGVKETLLATSGKEGMRRLAENPKVTTVLLDIMMPDMDGAKCLRVMAEQGSDARIILVSGADIDIIRNVANVGRDLGLNLVGFLSKPIHTDVLRLRLESAMRRKRRKPVEANAVPVESDPEPDIHQLMDAMSAGQITPWYQPKVDINDASLVGVEALARWRRPDGSLISPAVFVPAIEAGGLSEMLFFSMFKQVLADMQRWQQAGLHFRASVNLSMDCAFKTSLPGKMAAAINEYAIDPRQLVIEVTESRAMTDSQIAIGTLQKVSEMGVTLSIDDFGTGYSSLAQVAALPFGELKIDGSFVQQAGDSAKADAILQSTITLGRSLGMQVVAEGVEDHEQLDHLRLMGANVIQGFLMARPMAADALERWISDWRPGTKARSGCQRPVYLLVVDDDKAIREYLATLFSQSTAVKVFCAENGQAALKVLTEEPIDAATFDFHMPGIDGIQLLKAARDVRPVARYVLLTANSHESIAEEATRLGALYCPKPLTGPQTERILRYFEIDPVAGAAA